MVFTLPNIISMLRILLSPLLLLLAWQDKATLFLFLFFIALLSDALDGYLARRLQQTSELGSRLDSYGDLALFLPLPLEAWWLWPDLVLRELPFIGAAIAGLLVPLLIGWLKFRRLTSYHTYGAKIAAVLLALAIPLLLLGGAAWPFRAAVLVFLLAEIEEVLITLRLARYRSNVPSLRHLPSPGKE